nr:hypothetical transcript [Hymenolepis microstoma]
MLEFCSDIVMIWVSLPQNPIPSPFSSSQAQSQLNHSIGAAAAATGTCVRLGESVFVLTVFLFTNVHGFDGPSIGENRGENGFFPVAELGGILSSSGGTYYDVKENLLVFPVEYIIVAVVVVVVVVVVASNFSALKDR